MRHNNSWREEKLLYHNPARKVLGREREVQILNILLKELEGERLRAVMWLGCKVDTLIFALLQAGDGLFHVRGNSFLLLNLKDFLPFKTSLKTFPSYP